MAEKSDLFLDLYSAECKKSAKANFTVGWLTSALRDFLSAEEVNRTLEDARREADKIFGN